MPPVKIKGDEVLRALQSARDIAIRSKKEMFAFIDLTRPRQVLIATAEAHIPSTALLILPMDWNFSAYQDAILGHVEQMQTVIDEMTDHLRVAMAKEGASEEQIVGSQLIQRLQQARAGTLNLHDKKDEEDGEAHKD